jgi:hypothetical protein
MKFHVSYQKKEEFEIKELNIDLVFSEENPTDHPATTIIKVMVRGVIAIIAIASALAVYGAEHGQPELFGLADRVLDIHHAVIDIGRDWAIHLREKK